MTLRAEIAGARRVVVKVGSSSLTSLPGGLDEQRLTALVDVLGAVHAQGREVVLVSSGAIAAGLAPLGVPGRPRDLATAQAAASVGQLRLVQTYADAFARHDVTVGQVLLTADDLTRRSHYRNAQRTLERLLTLGVLPIVNENDTVATEEIRFGDNDRLAALVAHVSRAEALVLLSDVDGVYDGDPRTGPAQLVQTVHGPEDLANPHLYKTQPCRNFPGCPAGKLCTFAHGEEELPRRPAAPPPTSSSRPRMWRRRPVPTAAASGDAGRSATAQAWGPRG